MTNVLPLTVRVLAFDPGISEMGYAVLDYNTRTGKISVIKRGMLIGSKLYKERKDLHALFGRSFVILEAIYYAVLELIVEHSPSYVVSEGAFMHKFPATFASLTLIIHTIRRAAREALGYDIFEIAPMESKKAIANNSTAKKDEMRSAVLSREEIIIRDSKSNPVSSLTEHEIDAIAHGSTFVLKVLPTLMFDTKPIPQWMRSGVAQHLINHIEANLARFSKPTPEVLDVIVSDVA